MKSIFKSLILSSLLATMLWSCEKDENKEYFEGGTAPVLSATKTGTIPLADATKGNEAVKISWTNPNYKFSTGLSSQNVSYSIEMDTTGANFTNPKRVTVNVSGDLSKSFTQGELNDFLLNTMQLKAAAPHNIEMRVKSSLINNSALLFSNVLKFVVTPYKLPPKVAVPTTGKLFITGGATPGSWQCGCGEAELLTQKFNMIGTDTTLFELPSITLTGGGSYLLLPQYGSWSVKFGGVGGNNSNNVDGDDFKLNGSDLKAPAVTGNYKIVVDFQRGKFTVTKL